MTIRKPRPPSRTRRADCASYCRSKVSMISHSTIFLTSITALKQQSLATERVVKLQLEQLRRLRRFTPANMVRHASPHLGVVLGQDLLHTNRSRGDQLPSGRPAASAFGGCRGRRHGVDPGTPGPSRNRHPAGRHRVVRTALRGGRVVQRRLHGCARPAASQDLRCHLVVGHPAACHRSGKPYWTSAADCSRRKDH